MSKIARCKIKSTDVDFFKDLLQIKPPKRKTWIDGLSEQERAKLIKVIKGKSEGKLPCSFPQIEDYLRNVGLKGVTVMRLKELVAKERRGELA